MSAYRVSLDELLSVVDRLRTFQGQLEESFDEADTQARGLAANWTGAAATEYQEAHQRWRAGARLMHEAVGVMHTNTTLAHENYTAAGNTNASIWAL